MAARPKLKVLVASTSYPSAPGDWRGVFIRNMLDALASRPELDVGSWCPPGPLAPGVRDATTPSDARWLAGLANEGGIAHALRRLRPGGLLAAATLMRRLGALYERERDVDVLHANWLQVALPLRRPGLPVLATVLGTDYRLLSVPGMTTALRRVFRRRPTAICPNADWMVPGLQKRFGDIATIRCIPFGIRGDYFACRREPVSPARWLCVTRITQAKVGDLFAWGEAWFRDGPRELHLFGPMQEPVALPDWVHYHGPATPEALAGTWFPQATGLVSLSRHPEGRPQVMLEAMAAGLPIIASALPAHVDLLEPEASGAICRSPGELGTRLAELEGQAGIEMGLRGRDAARARFGSWDDCASRYVETYRALLGA